LGWLRSRWTVVALVPAFFLAGFGIVSALADGSDDPGPAGGSGGSTAAAGAQAIVTVIGEAGEATTAARDGGEDGSPADGGGGSGGGGGGGAPPAPPPGVVGVDYGRWEGVFELASPGILRGGGFASVTGELSYLGGVDCPVGLVRARTWLYDDRGRVVGETLWLSTDSTGEGAEVTGREPLPFDARAQVSQDASSAVVRFGVVQCL
jgi:hypothetical protein